MNSASTNPEDSRDRQLETISILDTDQLWDQVAETIERFYQAWSRDTATDEGNFPPRIEDFVPETPQAVRRFAIVELLKVDMENRLEQGFDFLSTTDYAIQFPELIVNGKIDNELLFEEFDLCRKFGQTIDPQQFLRQFPNQAATIEKLLGVAPQGTRTKPFRRDKSIRSIQAGDTIDDFELLIEVGKGAFATVFLARQISMQRLVALKVSADHGDEPKTLAQLDCKNIVRVFDVRDIAEPKCRLLYMKFVAGGTLQDIVRRARELEPSQRSGALFLSLVDERAEKTGQDVPLDSRTRHRLLNLDWTEVTFWIGSQIANGLAYAHRRQVLHRDLKPANVLLTTEGVPQIVDFNVSFCADVDGASAESFFGGSLAYMSPEQLEAFDPSHPRQPSDLDGASDVYGLGIILWELLFGERPFDDNVPDDDFSKLLVQLRNQREEFNIAQKLPDEKSWSIDLQDLFGRVLHPDPQHRYRNANALAGELNLLSDAPSRELLRPAPTPTRSFFQKSLIPFLIFAVVFPTSLAAIFNYFYNFISIIKPMGEAVVTKFDQVQTVINAVAFPVGIGILAFVGWMVQRKLKRFDAFSEDQAGVSTRKLILQLPFISVVIPLSIWILCGLAYPVALNMAGAELTFADSLHFITSLVLCGLIASVYPFFLVAHVAIRYWYPVVFRTESIDFRDGESIEQLTNRAWFFIMLGVLLPTFSILLMVTTQSESDRDLLAYLAGASFVGLGGIFLIFQKMQTALATIRQTVLGLLENEHST